MPSPDSASLSHPASARIATGPATEVPTDALAAPSMPSHWPRWVLVWGGLAMLALALQLALSGHFNWSTAFLMAANDTLPWFLAAPCVLWLAGRFPLETRHRLRNGALHLAAGLLCSVLLPLTSFGLLRLAGIEPMPGRMPPRWSPPPGGMPPGPPPPSLPRDAQRPPPPPPSWHVAVGRAPFHWPVYALILTAAHGWRATRRAHERERRAAELERLLAEARLTSLTRQLHPHFLFNTLNTIAEFVRSDPVRAEEMLVDLGELLRHTLRAASHPVVPLAEELALLDLYLDIQRARFGPRLQIVRTIAAEARQASVTVLMLQPLVENALRHGLDRSAAPVTVTIEASVSAGWILLAVRDNAATGTGAATGEGIGLSNTRRRLTALFGDAHCFSAGPGSDGGYAVELSFPLQPPDPSSPLPA